MNDLRTLFTVIGLTLSGEAVADFLASHASILLALGIIAFAGLFIFSVNKANSKNP